jgi:hypothetical protein
MQMITAMLPTYRYIRNIPCRATALVTFRIHNKSGDRGSHDIYIYIYMQNDIFLGSWEAPSLFRRRTFRCGDDLYYLMSYDTCSLVGRCRHFGGTYYPQLQGSNILNPEDVESTFLHQTARCHNPEPQFKRHNISTFTC